MGPDYDTSAPYIWAVYGLAVVIIGGMILNTAIRARAARKAQEAEAARRPE